MKSIIFCICFFLLAVIFGFVAVLCIKSARKTKKENEELKRELQEIKATNEKKEAAKDSLNTGNNKRDFDNSINILRNLKK